MDPIRNPYSPNAGAPPPALVGRDSLLAAFGVALGRIQIGRSQKSMLPTGLRGVGKTVLLNKFVEAAIGQGYLVAQIEASESDPFVEALAAELRPTLYELSAKATVRGVVSKALGFSKA